MAKANVKEILQSSYDGNTEILKLSNKIINKYSGDLDTTISEVNELMKSGNIDGVPSVTLEFYCVAIPSYLYYLTTGLEELGIKMDALEQEKKDKYNEEFLNAEGTVLEKKAIAELSVNGYVMAGIVYKRAYNCLKEKMTMSEKLYEGLKKILTKRISEHDLNRQSS